MTVKKKTKKQNPAPVERLFDIVAEAFVQVADVTRETKKGFGSGALKVKGKIFAMISAKQGFVVKLPNHRVNELVETGKGKPFVPGPGRVMKEWVVIEGKTRWVELAMEACDFVKQVGS